MKTDASLPVTNSTITISAEEVIQIVEAHLKNRLATSTIKVVSSKADVSDDGYEKYELTGITFGIHIPSPVV